MWVYAAFGELGRRHIVLTVVLFDVAPVDLVNQSFEFFDVLLLIFHPIFLRHLIYPEGDLVRGHCHACKLQRRVQRLRLRLQILAIISALSFLHSIGCDAFADHIMGDAGSRPHQKDNSFEEQDISRGLK